MRFGSGFIRLYRKHDPTKATARFRGNWREIIVWLIQSYPMIFVRCILIRTAISVMETENFAVRIRIFSKALLRIFFSVHIQAAAGL